MKKRMIPITLAVLCLLLLAACGCSHEWTEAHCLTPKTCTLCGETEGESLGHTWQEATCAAPKTCTLCKETEGEALPHILTEATYQSRPQCSVCGKEIGQKLEAAFRKYGIAINMTENKHYDYKTETGSSATCLDPYHVTFPCEKNAEYTTVGELYICDYRIIEADETHMAVEGYEWRAIDLEISFLDDNWRNYGVAIDNVRLEDYYDIEKFDSGYFDPAGTQWEYLSAAQGYVVNYHGVDYPVVISLENGRFNKFWRHLTAENGEKIEVEGSHFYASVYACVPIGYDGIVFGFSTTAEEGTPVYELNDGNLMLMRFGNEINDWWNEEWDEYVEP